MSITRFAFPTPIHFGAGARKLVAAHLLDQGLKRPLIVTDRALAALPLMAEFQSHLAGLQVAVFNGVFGNPTCAQVMAGAAAFKAHGADCVIGFGGGAALDVAKVVGVMAVHEGDVLQYVWDHPQLRPIVNPLPPFVALPTTSGTGSEVGRSAVVSENDSHVKRTVFNAKLLAQAVFADPELTLALPAAITAATGMDALTHNIESYLSPAYHPLCDGIALEGLRIGARALATAVHRAGQPAGARRHDDELDDGRDRVPEGPGLGACLRPCAGCGGRHAPWPGQRADDRHRAGLEPRSGAEEVRRTGPCRWAWPAVASPSCAWLKHLKLQIGISGGLAAHGVTPGHAAAPGAAGRDRLHRQHQPPARDRGRLRAPVPPGDVIMPFKRPYLMIGVSARIYYPSSPVLDLGGVWTKTLHYLEQSVAHWLLHGGALAVMIPAVDSQSLTTRADFKLGQYAEALDALVLQGGNDVAPQTYGEQPLRPEWAGDPARKQTNYQSFFDL